MGRARGTKKNRGSGEPAPGRWPPELEDLQRRGGMSPDWHEATHAPGRGVGPIGESSQDPFSFDDRETVLLPLVWEAHVDIDGKAKAAFAGRRDRALGASKYLAGTPLAQEIEALYISWEERLVREGFYGKVMGQGKIETRNDLIRFWSSIFSSPTRENRRYALQRELPRLSREEQEELLDLFPEPHHLLVSGDSSILRNPEEGEWSLEVTKIKGLFE